MLAVEKIFTDARCDLWQSEGKESYERARAAYVATEVRLLLALRVVGKEPASEAPASREPRRVPATPPYSRCTSGRRARALTQKTAEVRAERHLRYAWVPGLLCITEGTRGACPVINRSRADSD